MPVAQNIFRYASSTVYRRLLGILYAFIKPKLLSPEMYGLWAIVALLPRYAMYGDLGSREGLRFRLPLLHARGDHRGAAEIQSSVFLGTLASYGAIAAAMALLAALWDTWPQIRAGLAAMALVTLLRWYSGYRLAVLKALGDFGTATRSNYLRATLAVAAGIPGMLWMGIYGLFLSLVFTELAVGLYLRGGAAGDRGGRFRFGRLADMVRQGAPVMLFNVFTLAIRSADRVIVTALLGLQQMGFYGLAVTIFSLLVQIPGASREVLEPELMRRAERLPLADLVRRHFFSPLLHTAGLMPFAIGPVLFLLPDLLPLALPRYTQAALPAQVLALASFFMALAFSARGLIVAQGWQLPSLGVLGLALLINLAATQFLVARGMGLFGAGLGSLLSLVALYGGLFLFIRRRTGSAVPTAEWRHCFLASWIPILLTLALFLLLGDAGLGLAGAGLPSAAACWLAHGLCMLGVLYLGRRLFPMLRPSEG